MSIYETTLGPSDMGLAPSHGQFDPCQCHTCTTSRQPFGGAFRRDDAVAMKQPAPQGFHTEPVCNCHDCTQARGRWLAEQVKRDYETFTSILGSFENRLMEHISYKSGVLASIFDQLARIEQSQATLAGEIDKWSHDAEPPKAYWETHFGRICFVSDEDRDRASSFLSDHELGAYKRGKAERAVAKQKAPRSSSQARRGKVRGDRGRKR